MLILFASQGPAIGAAAGVAPIVKEVPTKALGETKGVQAPKEAMGTILELDQEVVLATFKGGFVKRKDVVFQLKSTGINLNNPQPKKVIHELEKRLALSIAFQKYVNSLMKEATLSPQDQAMLQFIRSQFITKSYLTKRVKANISDEKVKSYYEQLRLKAQNEILYKISICVVAGKEKAMSIINAIKSRPKSAQKAEFVKFVTTDSLFDANKKEGGALPPLTKEKLKTLFSQEAANKVAKYAKGSLIAEPIEVKGSYFVFFLDDMKKMAESMPSVDKVNLKEVRPMLTAQLESEGRLGEMKKIVEKAIFEF